MASSILMKRRWLWLFEGWWPGLLTMIATSKGMRGLLLRESCTCTFMCALWWQKDWTCIPCLCVDSRQAHIWPHPRHQRPNVRAPLQTLTFENMFHTANIFMFCAVIGETCHFLFPCNEAPFLLRFSLSFWTLNVSSDFVMKIKSCS